MSNFSGKIEKKDSVHGKSPEFESIDSYMDFPNMDNRGRISFNDKRNYATPLRTEIKAEMSDTILTKKESKRSGSSHKINDDKDLLIAQLQDQVAKQRECISHYESIVQLMNYRLMKLKKILRAHQLLGELD